MKSFENELQERLAVLRELGLYRELRRVDSAQSARIEIAGRPLLNFSSNDYLGLANEPVLKEAARRAVAQFGCGSGASRLICGSLAPHHELEETLADWKGTEAALTFSTGYAAALGTITALLGRDDVIVIDKLVHACIVDAARLSGATLRVFKHNNMEDLERILKWADARAVPSSKPKVQSSGARVKPHVLIVTESVFSMDGDHAPLRRLVELKEKYGAWLMVDEAHATGLYGEHRRGLAEQQGVGENVEIQMGTLGKALGASGGYICGSRTLISCLVNRARSFIYSTAPVPAAAAAATAGVRLVQSAAGKERGTLLWKNVSTVTEVANRRPDGPPSAIIPLIIGDEKKTVKTAMALLEQGIFIPAIRYPTVARGVARLRITLTAAHSVADVAQLIKGLGTLNIQH